MARRRGWAAVAAAAALVALCGVGVAVAAAGDETVGPAAAFAKSSDWGTGYEGRYTVTNTGTSTMITWRVEFSLPPTAVVGSFWEAIITRSGNTYIATSKSYNGNVAPGGSTSFGFVVTGRETPLTCTVNGGPCAMGGATPTASAMPTTGSPTASSTAIPTANQPAPTSGAPTSAPTRSIAAPYVDMGAWPTPSLTTVMSSSGLRNFTLAFITGAGCKASWFGAYDPRTGWAKDQIDAVRANGGDVRVSFGGASGVELAQGCTDVTSLASEYQAVVAAYALTAIDLDIEGAAAADAASIDRRSKALAQVQKRTPGLRISFTLPVLPEGLTADGLSVLRSAIDAGVSIDVVNVMAMDYYRDGDYGGFAVQAATSTFTQLKTLYPSTADATLWRRVGVTPMLGKNDDGRIFDQADAKQLVSFAAGKHLGMLGFWEVSRDANACSGALYKCTNITQEPYEFSRIFAGFAG